MSSWPVPGDHLDLIAGRARDEGALCVPVIEPGTRFHLAGAIAQAAVQEMALWHGMLAAGLPGSPGTRTLPRPTGKSYGQRTEYLAIATFGDDQLSRLRAGEATSAALLCATELGLASCPLSQPLEIADTRRLIRDDILDGAAEPQLVIRLGWAPADADRLPSTPRRELDDVIDR